jgi:hypothetical protein
VGEIACARIGIDVDHAEAGSHAREIPHLLRGSVEPNPGRASLRVRKTMAGGVWTLGTRSVPCGAATTDLVGDQGGNKIRRYQG